MDIFRSGIRPAVNTGLSVTRVGGVGHNSRQKDINVAVMRIMSSYRQALEYSRFGSELSAESQATLMKGKMINAVITQRTGEFASLMAQQLMMQIILDADGTAMLNVDFMKSIAMEYAAKVDKDGGNFDKVKADLLAAVNKGPSEHAESKSKQDYVAEQLEKDKAEADKLMRSDE